MCGILAIFDKKDATSFRRRAVDLQKKLAHRGPDWSGFYLKGGNIIAHERLAIVDPESGDQPLYGRDDQSLVLCANGEIYNHVELIRLATAEKRLKGESIFNSRTRSDCESLLHLYDTFGAHFLQKVVVNGMFAFVLLDERTNHFIIGRDHVGIIPLYYGRAHDGSFWVASEMKVLIEDCAEFHIFPPGHFYDSESNEFTPFLATEGPQASNFFVCNESNIHKLSIPTQKIDPGVLRDAFEKTVVTHLMSDVPYGVLLSGGLDSSLVASIMARHCRLRMETMGCTEAYYPRLHSFSIGLEGSPDHEAARKVAEFLDTVHHEYTFTLQQGIDALSHVVHHIESFDATTIRASTPMYLMARKIRSTGVKMVLSGEGADEMFGGYLYFHKAPNPEEFHKECIRKVSQLHLYDCLRANKSMMAWGVEARVPFLDRSFMELVFGIDPAQKMCLDEITGEPRCEKHLLRTAFEGRGYLPEEILWRQKEQFSDGVGYTWIDAIQRYAESMVTNEQMESATVRFPEKTPLTKESYLYRDLFAKHFGENNKSCIQTVGWQDSIACSSDIALKWDPSFSDRADASGRSVVGVHQSPYS